MKNWEKTKIEHENEQKKKHIKKQHQLKKKKEGSTGQWNNGNSCTASLFLTLRPAAVPDLLIYVATRFMTLLFYRAHDERAKKKQNKRKEGRSFFNPFNAQRTIRTQLLMCGSNGLRRTALPTYLPRVWYLLPIRARYAEMHFTPLRRAFLLENYLDF